jgi:hypothetical protein
MLSDEYLLKEDNAAVAAALFAYCLDSTKNIDSVDGDAPGTERN